MQRLIVGHFAMGTRYELVLFGKDPVALRAAADEAFAEVDRVDRELSVYRQDSEINRVNALAFQQPVRVSPPVFELLETCWRLWEQTNGAFDITVGPLIRVWGFFRRQGKEPPPEELRKARSCVGMQWVRLDPEDRTVRFERPGMMLDLGGIGKGYAIDRAVQLLQDLEYSVGFIHSGTSTMFGWGKPPDLGLWKVGIPTPETERLTRMPWAEEQTPDSQAKPSQSNHILPEEKPLAVVEVEDCALSVSSIYGRAFEKKGKVYGHIVDPRTGRPVQRALLSAVRYPRATEADTLSTALLVLGAEEARQVSRRFPQMQALVVRPVDQQHWQVESLGLSPNILRGP